MDKLYLPAILILALGAATATAVADEALPQDVTPDDLKQLSDAELADGWIQLFDGENLDGWRPKIRGFKLGENWNDTFQVEAGCLKVDYQNYDAFDRRFGHLFYKTPFSHYIIRVEYRFTGEQCPGGPGWARRNSGIMIHGQDPQSMAVDQDFPVSIEVQLLGGFGDDHSLQRPTANLCTPGTHVEINDQLITRHCTNSSSPTFFGDQWVTVEVEVHGNQVIRHKVNGKDVLEYQKPQLDPGDGQAKRLIKGEQLLLDSGSISLQSESHPIEFRKVELMVLKDRK